MLKYYSKLMQPILIVALIGVAAAATGVGFLNGNTIMLNVQSLGVGSADLESPISNANVDLSIDAVEGVGPDGETIFFNVIDVCSFHYDAFAGFTGLLSADDDATVICKLTDMNHNVVAEGSITGSFAASQTYFIPITDLAYPGSNDVSVVGDVTIVALGDDPTP
jgi:hypothetical protein